MSVPAQVSHARPGALGIQSILQREIRGAIAAVSGRRSAVHAARKAVKASRAILRLLRPALSERDYHQQNYALRDAGRLLSAARDAEVLAAIAGKLAGRTHDRGLETAAPRLEEAARSSGVRARDDFPAFRTRLRAVLARSDDWVLPTDFELVRQGLRCTYRKARRQARHNRAHPTPPRLHEWRKASKHLLTQLRLFTPLQHASLAATCEDLKELTDCLGREHDLAVLDETLGNGLGLGGHEQKRARREVAARRRKVRRNALALGKTLFACKSSQFERRIRRYLRYWEP